MKRKDPLRIVDIISLWVTLVVILTAALLVSGCTRDVHVSATSPESYHLSTCSQEHMERMHRNKLLPFCMIRDFKEMTDLNLKIEARRKLEGN